MPIEVSRAVSAGETVWWANAVLAQTCSPDDAAALLTGSFHGLADGAVSGPGLVGALRGRGIHRLTLAIVEPADPVGVPGPAEVARAAVSAGLAAVTDDAAMTLIPAEGPPPLVWTAVPSRPGGNPAAPLGSWAEAHSLMREAMVEISRSVPAMSPDDDALAELDDYRRFSPPAPPPGIPARACQVADAALRVWWLTGTAGRLAQRLGKAPPEPVRRLRPLARRAASAAFSAAPGGDP